MICVTLFHIVKKECEILIFILTYEDAFSVFKLK